MSVLDRFRSDDQVAAREVGKLREQLQQERWNTDLIMESLQKVEAAMNEEGWRELSAQIRMQLSRGGLDNMAELSRAMYISNPLIQRAVNVRAYYTWAQGITVQADDDKVQQAVIDPLHADPLNKAEMFSHQAQILTDIDQTCDGNIFTALFTNMRGDVAVRTIPMDEIRQIIRSEEDYGQIMFYKRVWTQMTLDESSGTMNQEHREAYYPDINFQPLTKPTVIGGWPVFWDAPIIHQRTGGLKRMAFGVPETYAALDWARAYRKFLEDWHSIVASLARFAWEKTSKGSRIKRAKERLQRTLGSEATEPDEDEGQSAGAVHVTKEGESLTPIKTSGATTSAEDAKPSRMMVGSAMDLPDTILSGDPQQGNLATAKTLDRPTELSIVSRQEMWVDHRKQIYNYAWRQRMIRGQGALRLSPATSAMEPPDINVSFPAILEHDIKETVGALVAAATLEGKTESQTIPHAALAQKLMEELGYDDIDELLKDLEQEIQDKEKKDAEAAAQFQQQQGEMAKAKDQVAKLGQLAKEAGLV